MNGVKITNINIPLNDFINSITMHEKGVAIKDENEENKEK